MRYIELIEECVGKKAELDMQPMQPGDVPDTCADVTALKEDVGYEPSTPVEVGVPRFVEWYQEYYGRK
jgi:UDP-glucuronate 4-epimerase